MGQTQHPVYTIGHSNHSPKYFLALLQQHDVEVVSDVRSAPYSGYAPHFNHDALKEMLESRGIGYIFLGGELGGRPSDRSCYDQNGRVQYDRVAETDFFEDGISRLIHRADAGPVALLCTEKEPLDCHRTLLVARRLVEAHVDVQHILGDGKLEDHDTSMDRLLDTLKLPPNGDLFRSRDEVIAEALNIQAHKVAYVERVSPIGREIWEEAL